MVDIVFAISCSTLFPQNPRSRKIIKSLSKRFAVLVLEWDREKKYMPSETIDERIIVKRFNFRAPYGSPFLVFLWPLFWFWLVANIIAANPKIIYSCNLDATIPCYISKILLLKKPKIVFDSFDKFSLAHVPTRSKLFFRIVDFIENVLAYNADAFITVSDDRLVTYGRFIPRLVGITMNCPEDMLNGIKDTKMSIPKKSDGLALVYAGPLSKRRGLIILKKAIDHLDNVSLYLAGYIYDNVICELSGNHKIHYLGLLPYEESIKLQAQADVIPILYDPEIAISRVANPNKLFEAMMLGVPVITNVCSEIVRETGCGLIVKYDPKSIRDAIVKLRDNPSLRKELGAKGRQAFERRYNWTLMEEKLFKLLDKLLKPS